MKDYKVILLGSQCSGKSTLIKYLQENTDLVCIDHDEEIKRRNGGIYPQDSNYVSDKLLPQIEKDILTKDNIIYSASFWGLGVDRDIHDSSIENAIEKGFIFINLFAEKELLEKRNELRMKEGKDDCSGALDWYLHIYQDMEKKNYFKMSLNMDRDIEDIAEGLEKYIYSL